MASFAAEREAKKVREAERLRALSSAETLEMGFQLMWFAKEVAEGAERARAST